MFLDRKSMILEIFDFSSIFDILIIRCFWWKRVADWAKRGSLPYLMILDQKSMILEIFDFSSSFGDFDH